ncbi:hypothetical protein MKW92_005295 [Papaver armeniacum]|nr:hypothetical protein MKW92_005295 [Papaver armeniacum]
MNEEGQNMDLYIPRKCSATNRIITAKHHVNSVQFNIGHIASVSLSGYIRAQFFLSSLVWGKEVYEWLL